MISEPLLLSFFIIWLCCKFLLVHIPTLSRFFGTLVAVTTFLESLLCAFLPQNPDDVIVLLSAILSCKERLTRSSSYHCSRGIFYPCTAAAFWILFYSQFGKKSPDTAVEGWFTPPLRLRPHCKYLFFSY